MGERARMGFPEIVACGTISGDYGASEGDPEGMPKPVGWNSLLY
jgi:hypothetical protein